MAQTKLGEQIAITNGDLPAIGSVAPEFVLTGNDMKDVHSTQFAGKNIILNIFPSVDTTTCGMSVREFNKRAADLLNTQVLCVSKDLPFAMRRFCGAEGIDKVITASDFRNRGFSTAYGVELTNGGFTGLCARAVIIIDSDGKIKYTQLVPQIGHEPDYDEALAAL